MNDGEEQRERKRKRLNSKKSLTDLPPEVLIDIASRLQLSYNNTLSYAISKSNDANRPCSFLAYDSRQHIIELVRVCQNNNNNNIDVTVTPIYIDEFVKELRSPKSLSFKVLCVNDGLLLVQLLLPTYNNNVEPILRLVNPVTCSSRVLPPSPQFFTLEMPTQNYYGMGYSPMTGQLKIVRLSFAQTHPRCETCIRFCAEVLELGCSTPHQLKWRRIDVDSALRRQVIEHHGVVTLETFKGPVLLNGTLHWLVDNYQYCLLRFDLDKEKFDLVDYTPTYHYYSRKHIERIGLFGSSFYISIDDEKTIEVWVMKEYGVKKSWTRLYKSTNNDDRKKVLHVLEDGKMLILSTTTDRLYLYDSINDEGHNNYGAFDKLGMFVDNRNNMIVLPFVPNVSLEIIDQ